MRTNVRAVLAAPRTHEGAFTIHGALALLRNLRGMIAAGVSEDSIRDALASMRVERVLPFRFITAARYAPQLEDALEQAMFKCLDGVAKLPGKTALLVDHSGSMSSAISRKSELSRWDAACGLAMLVREICERARVFAFSDRCAVGLIGAHSRPGRPVTPVSVDQTVVRSYHRFRGIRLIMRGSSCN